MKYYLFLHKICKNILFFLFLVRKKGKMIKNRGHLQKRVDSIAQ